MSYGVNIGDKVLIRGVIVKREGDEALVRIERSNIKAENLAQWFDIELLLPEVVVEQAVDPVIDEKNSVE